MTIVLSEDWSSYAADTQLNAIAGWSTYGQFPNNENAIKVNATSQLKVVSFDSGVGYYNTGSNSHYAEVVAATQFSGSFIYMGVAVGISSRLN